MMSPKKPQIIVLICLGVVFATALLLLALTLDSVPSGQLLAFVSAIISSISLTFAFLILFRRRIDKRRVACIYVSFPYNTQKDTVDIVKKQFRGYPILYSDDFVKPGEDYRDFVGNNLRNVNICFMLISGELSPRQKYEVKELKKSKARITPVLENSTDSVPQSLIDYQPMTLDSFLSLAH